MQFFSKNFATLSILFLNYSISFGMISDSNQKICNELFIYTAAISDAKVKNVLQKINKMFNDTISQKNNNFLLMLDRSKVARIDKENIWLRTNNKNIEEYFKLSKEEIVVRSCYDNVNDFIPKISSLFCPIIRTEIPLASIGVVRFFHKNCNTNNKSSINSIEEYFDVKNIGSDRLVISDKNMIKFLQTASLLNSEKAISLVFDYIDDNKINFSTISLDNRENATFVILEECIRRNNKEAFQLIFQKNPLSVSLSELECEKMIRDIKGVHDSRKTSFCEIIKMFYIIIS